MPPGIITLGTLGNLLIILTVSVRKFSSFTIYLASLAVADIFVLYTQTLNLWLENVLEIQLKLHSDVLCKLYYFFIFLCPQISSWLIMCLTVERTICTFFSTRVKQFPGPKVGLIVVGVILLVLCTLSVHALYGRGIVLDKANNSINNVTKVTCGFTDAAYKDFYYRFWNMINFVVYFAVPFLVIVVGNSLTTYSVYRSFRSIDSMTESTANSTIRQKVRNVFLITLLVSIAFVVLVTPLPLLFLFNRVNTMEFPAALFVHMLSLNHSINFLLYIISGSRFREDLKTAFRRLCGRQGEEFEMPSNSGERSTETSSKQRGSREILETDVNSFDSAF